MQPGYLDEESSPLEPQGRLTLYAGLVVLVNRRAGGGAGHPLWPVYVSRLEMAGLPQLCRAPLDKAPQACYCDIALDIHRLGGPICSPHLHSAINALYASHRKQSKSGQAGQPAGRPARLAVDTPKGV